VAPPAREVGRTLAKSPFRCRLRQGAALLLAAAWLTAAFTKVAEWSWFVSIVRAHGIVAEGWRSWLWLIPVAELGAGLCLGWAAAPDSRKTARLAALFSAGLLGGLTAYNLLVTESVLTRYGCGCFGRTAERLLGGISWQGRTAGVSINLALMLLHFPLVFCGGCIEERT